MANALGLVDEALEALGELDAAALDADEDEAVDPVGALDDLGGHPRQGTAQRRAVHEGSTGGHRGRKVVR